MLLEGCCDGYRRKASSWWDYAGFVKGSFVDGSGAGKGFRLAILFSYTELRCSESSE